MAALGWARTLLPKAGAADEAFSIPGETAICWLNLEQWWRSMLI